MVSNTFISTKKYDLTVNNYIEKEKKRVLIDIKELNKKIETIVENENLLREKINKIIKV